ncbi:beta-galactosidase family protein [Lysobacter sp. BMK333-48F3]|uniref:glycoside hydrolase family 35 protein n=1 Tax=Lysobacter sp. BMK333-48F3 TaxID=2867962 RepID=UPI0021047948|nr:beta-galactosidase family protein [Lysobacter sp. BMK333-48F3]
MPSMSVSRSLAAALLGLALALPAQAAAAPRFAIDGDRFLLDGKPHLIRSGELHYPRIPRAFWRERLRQAKAMGLNTVTTYVFWNLHEPEPGRFDFSGDLDIAAFVRTAAEEGLDVIVRPGPYICTELDFGGYPAWLLRTPGLRVRSMDPRYLAAGERYLRRVHQELGPLLSTRGGPILMMQVENEYGSYGRDRDYMATAKRQMIEAGFDLPLFTSDGAGPHYFEGGPLPGVTAVINFDGDVADAEASFAHLKAFRPDGPRMVGEYWAGWFDHWGEQHHTTPPERAARTVGWFLERDISFNLYMFHGGTSFGWMAGANYSRDMPYQPDTTSYDYDAPVDEAGRPTPKYHALREVIGRHLPAGETLPPLPAPAATTVAVPRFALSESVSLWDALPALSRPVSAQLPRTMEDLQQNYGFVLYRNTVPAGAQGKLSVDEVRDYANVFADGKPVGTLDRRFGERELEAGLKPQQRLDLLVENMGRINFGTRLDEERKGITRSVAVGGRALYDWNHYPLPLSDLSGLRYAKTGAGAPAGPRFWRGGFQLERVGSTFLDTRGWGKGHVWVNGHHLGRYWKIGPQQTLFVPAPWLRPGRNEVVVFEVEGGAGARSLQGLTDPVYATDPDGLKPVRR